MKADKICAYEKGKVRLESCEVKPPGENEALIKTLFSTISPGTELALSLIHILNDQFGVINHVLMELKIIEKPILFLTTRYMSRFTVTMIGVWKNLPFMTITLLAGMQGIPGELYAVSYTHLDTVDCLKEGLKAVNWYVRLNSAETLIMGLKIPKKDLFDVYNGRDRYAREILNYVTEKIEIKGQEMELRETDV